MKKRIKVLFLFALLFIPNIVLADADDTKCSNVIDTLDSYKVSVSKLESIDCENTVSTEDIEECNKNSLNRSLSLSKLIQYNDSMPECTNSEIESIIKENENSCTGVFDSSLKKLTNNYLKIFYIIAPFLLIIFGSVDLFKILAMTSTEMANKAKKDLRKRVIAFVLLYLTPMMVNFIISFNGSDYNLSGNAYVCKNNVYYEKGEIKYIGLAQVSQKFLSNININSLTGINSTPLGVNSQGSKAIIEAAAQIHQKYINENWSYSVSSSDLTSGDIKGSLEVPGHHTCCATYINQIFYVAKIFSEGEINDYSYNSAPSTFRFLRDKNWIKISNYGDLQPGDIVFMNSNEDGTPGHVQLYYGDGKWYNAGRDEAILDLDRTSPYPADLEYTFMFAYRLP